VATGLWLPARSDPLHGDFRYQSIKNLADDLLTQDKDLGKCLASAGNRFGLVVAGYSGRDESVMALIEEALAGPNTSRVRLRAD